MGDTILGNAARGTALSREEEDLINEHRKNKKKKTHSEHRRKQILEILSEGPKTTKELCEILGLTQPSVSKYLNELVDDTLVEGHWYSGNSRGRIRWMLREEHVPRGEFEAFKKEVFELIHKNRS